MIDIANQLKAIHREVGKRPSESGEVVAVLLQRSYDAVNRGRLGCGHQSGASEALVHAAER